jgi:hypothetical protein
MTQLADLGQRNLSVEEAGKAFAPILQRALASLRERNAAARAAG